MIKACIFDLDGTLADTLESMAAVANELMDEIGLERQPVDHFRYYCGEGANMLVRRCLKDAGDPQLMHYEEVCRSTEKGLMQTLCIKSGSIRGFRSFLTG